jgi:hypothetical protein
MESVSKVIEELEANPVRFRARGGYERLLDLLREGHAADAVRGVLKGHSEIAGDVLWTVAQLENVAPFVSEAEMYLSSDDKATAAYAMEVVLRGAQDPGPLLAALDRLRSCDVAVCEHAVRTLAGEGLDRLVEMLRIAGGAWLTLAGELTPDPIRKETVEKLTEHDCRDHQVVGLVLATLACEQDESFANILRRSNETWIRGYGEWLVSE